MWQQPSQNEDTTFELSHNKATTIASPDLTSIFSPTISSKESMTHSVLDMKSKVTPLLSRLLLGLRISSEMSQPLSSLFLYHIIDSVEIANDIIVTCLVSIDR